MSSEFTTAQEFAARLTKAMRAAGHVSTGSASGVDVAALARAASISYEMARRYAGGLAVPRPRTVQKIAKWLGVSPGELFWGDTSGLGGVDCETLEECLSAVAAAQKRTGATLSPEKAASIVALLYQEATQGRRHSPASLDLLLRAG
jgi:transcriptional regulator with XRE-family HTH domain